MPPGGAHLAAGCLLARWAPDALLLGGAEAAARAVRRRRGGDGAAAAARLGFVLGSILPDSDLILTVLTVALTRDQDWIEAIHRKATHSLPLILAAAWLARRCALQPAEGKGGAAGGGGGAQWQQWPLLAPYVRSRPELAHFVFGLCLGAACHVLLDLTYLQPFSPLWPYVGRTWGPFFGPTKSELDAFDGGSAWKWVTFLDFLSDPALFYLPLLWVCRTKGLHVGLRGKVAVFAAAQLAVLAVFLPALHDRLVSHEDFILWLHVPGFFWIVFSMVSPLMLRDAVVAIVTTTGDDGVEAAGGPPLKQAPPT